MDKKKDQFIAHLFDGLPSVSADEAGRLWEMAKKCKPYAVAMAGGAFMMGAKVGGASTITVGGLGAIPVSVASALVGLLAGTISCTALSYSTRDKILELARTKTDAD